jgi:hypothetical protein
VPGLLLLPRVVRRILRLRRGRVLLRIELSAQKEHPRCKHKPAKQSHGVCLSLYISVHETSERVNSFHGKEASCLPKELAWTAY